MDHYTHLMYSSPRLQSVSFHFLKFAGETKSFGLSGIYCSLKIGRAHSFFPNVVSATVLMLSLAHTGAMLSSRILLSGPGKAHLTQHDITILMLP